MKNEQVRYNLDYIKECEEKYTPTANSHKRAEIHEFYRNYLRIGGGLIIPEENVKEELERLYNLIKSDEFKKKYNRDFNILDMYLTTNLQVRDLCENYVQYMNKEQIICFLRFVSANLISVDSGYSRRTSYISNSKAILMSRFYRPTQRCINLILNNHLINYGNIEATDEDIQKAHEILLDLNEKYGVKYDDISLFMILKSYLKGEINSYYEIAEEYKSMLDKTSHVQKRCIPLLTRREKN